MNYFEKQMHNIFGESMILPEDKVFTNRTMIVNIGQNLRAKVDFIYTHIAKHYDAMKLSIINRTEGVVDSQVFKFSDIIGRKNGTEVYIWDDSGSPCWYMYKPTYDDFRQFESSVEEYILMYADQNMVNRDGFDMSGM